MNGSFAFLTMAVLASGYVFSTRCYWVKYRIARQSGHRLYLSVATYGFLFLVVTSILSLPFSGLENTYSLSVLTLLIGLVITETYNRKVPDAKGKALLTEWNKDDLELICARASLAFKPISVTLDTGKVYVGMIADSVEPDVDKSYLSLLPVFSGYREEGTLSYKLNHKYETVIDHLLSDDAEQIASFAEARLDYVIVVPRERIVTIHIFNPDLYEEVSGDDIELVGLEVEEES